MSEMACVFEMNMVDENEEMQKDFLVGHGLEVLFCLMDKIETQQEISRKIGIPLYSVNLYLQRLKKAGLINEEELVSNGEVEKIYSLVSGELEIINRLEENTTSISRRKLEMAANHYARMAKYAICSAGDNSDKPNSIKSYFMKTDQEKMELFKKEIDQLFEKYQELEDEKCKETYSLFTVLAPYGMEVS